MILSQRGTPPKQFGAATLELVRYNKVPCREKDVIYLPDSPYNQLIPLNEQQFLFLERGHTQGVLNSAWFGGTDELPFLVQLDPGNVVASYFQGGPSKFYEELKPLWLRLEEERLGREARRQGDIFFLSLGVNWLQIEAISRLTEGLLMEVATVKCHSVFDTRHTLKGKWGVIKARNTGIVLRQFAHGLLEAPDHEPQQLEDVCLLGQTAHLFNPAKAD